MEANALEPGKGQEQRDSLPRKADLRRMVLQLIISLIFICNMFTCATQMRSGHKSGLERGLGHLASKPQVAQRSSTTRIPRLPVQMTSAIHCLTVSLAAMPIESPTAIVTNILRVSFAMPVAGWPLLLPRVMPLIPALARCTESIWPQLVVAIIVISVVLSRRARLLKDMWSRTCVEQVRGAHKVWLPAPVSTKEW